MGLYDNVHAINSTRIPSFVADHSKEIGDYITQANQKHEATTGLMDATEDMLKNAPISSDDQENYANLLTDAKTHLSTLSSRPSLADATGEAYRLARQVKDRLTPLVNRTAQEAAWHKELDARVLKETKDGGIDQITKQRAIEASRRLSTPIQLDANGRQVPGTGFVPIDVAPNIDKTAELKKFLDLIPDQEWADASEGDDGMLKTSNRAAYKDKLPSTIRQQFEGFIQNNKPWMAMNARDAMLATSEATAGVSNESVLQELDKIPDTPEKALWVSNMNKAMADGKSALEAYKVVTHEDALNFLRGNDLNQALGGAKHDVNTGRTAGPGWQVEAEAKAKADADAKAKLEKQDRLITEGATYNIAAWGKDSEDLEKNLTSFDGDISNLQSEITNKTSLASKATGYDKTALLSEKALLEDQLSTLTNRKEALTQAKTLLLDKATQAQTDNKIASFEDLKTQSQPGIVRALKEAYPKGLKTLDGTSIPYEALANAVVFGGEKINQPSYPEDDPSYTRGFFDLKPSGGSLPTTHSITYKGKVYEYTTDRTGNNGNVPPLSFFTADQKNKSLKVVSMVQDKAKELIKSGLSLKTSSIGVTDKDQDLLRGIVGQSPITYDDGSIEKPANADYSKATFSDYSKSLGTVRVTVPIGVNQFKSGIMDVQKSDYNEKVAADMSSSKNINQQRMARDVAYNNSAKYQSSLGPGSITTVHPATGKPLELNGQSFAIQRVGNLFNVVFDETPATKDNRGNISVPATKSFVELNGKPLHNKSFSDIESLLNDLIDYAARPK